MQRRPRRTSRCRVTPQDALTSENSLVSQLDAGPRVADGLADSARTRQDRLAAIRAAIAEGRYRVSSEDLAQALINHIIKE
ncbi:MAG: flagellar biosynthesis anti-sigma factor FlgM [Acidobacteriaceae bacterium]